MSSNPILFDEDPDILDEQTAADAVDRVLTLDDRIRRVEAERDAFVRRCEARIEHLRAERAQVWDGLRGPLQRYYEAHPPRRGRTLHLPTGSLAMRVRPGGPRKVDEAAVKSWAAAEAPDFLVEEYVSRLRWADLKKAVEAGEVEVPPGVEMVDDSETFEVKAPKG